VASGGTTEVVPIPVSLPHRRNQNPNGLTFVESHFSQRTREINAKKTFTIRDTGNTG